MLLTELREKKSAIAKLGNQYGDRRIHDQVLDEAVEL